ncbi:ankyrin repeat PH and SEC7 domain containing [Micractinium conductrix]|uniref:Ankyrin repeat PH and SEC7 domain containing n=1 Tax=Micractinium conductrix TaxID=554055 RepID=A0A2P6V8D4_9CHLO|nr:ankyrin repeat PH and SEC7 domain containing [Micractinium conductrix]|eukprot:PSC70341.1 ankyrin repeat PH and SEC7 domain containing [Micractinium conductrix]
MPLVNAAAGGKRSCVEALLAAGALPNAFSGDWPPLAWAARRGHTGCVEALLAGSADPNQLDADGWTALHQATSNGAACMPALLAAGADPLAIETVGKRTPLHWATHYGEAEAMQHLLEAAPEAAALKDRQGDTPLALALLGPHDDEVALLVLEKGSLQPAEEVLALIHEIETHLGTFDPLYAPYVARQPLTPHQWELIHTDCPVLAAALPAVLRRSTVEAGLLVHRLPPEHQARLRTAALCLGRMCVPALPTPLMWHLLALSVTP